jgi:hypothetical protein
VVLSQASASFTRQTMNAIAATMTLAKRQAIQATKAELRAQSLKPSYIPHREIVVRAEQYLAQHRAELIAEAKAIVERWQAEGFFGRTRRKALSHKAFCCADVMLKAEERRMIVGYTRVSTDGQTLDPERARSTLQRGLPQ